MKTNGFFKLGTALAIFLLCATSSQSSYAASVKPKCKGETLRIYNKALNFYVPSLMKLEIALEIKDLYDQKSDFTTKELYDVQQNDKEIERLRADTNEYKPIVQRLAKTCKVSFTQAVREARKKY